MYCFKKILFNLILFLVLISCGKNDPINCDFDVAPLIEVEQGSDQYVDTSVVGYAFYADSVYYKIESYEQTEQAVVVSKVDGSTLSYVQRVEVNEQGVILFPDLSQGSVMLLLVEKDYKIYAWRQLYLEPGIAYLTTRLRFRPWRGDTYKESGWTVVTQPLPDEEEDNDEEEDGDDEGEPGDGDDGEQEGNGNENDDGE